MKKAVIVLSTIYLTSCGITKPVVLSSAQMNPLNTIQKAYTNTNTRNGANDMEIVKGIYTSFTSPIDGTIRVRLESEIYITPYNNPSYFDFTDDNVSTGQEGNYRSFDTNIFFQTKASCRIRLYQSNNLIYYWTNSETMLINTSQASKNTKAFKMYKLPYNISTQADGNISRMLTYVYTNTLETKMNIDGNFIVNPYNYTYTSYENNVKDGQIYYFRSEDFNIADFLPPLEDPNANRLGLYYYNNIETIGAMTLQRPQMIHNDEILSDYSTELNQILMNFFECNDNTNGYLTYQYNASISDELTAYETGYSQGIEEGTSGVGTTRIQQVFRAIQSFLNIDFGFFKLAHVLGGMLVIAIVIFIVRWFR